MRESWRRSIAECLAVTTVHRDGRATVRSLPVNLTVSSASS
jgi:hypothetical protein